MRQKNVTARAFAVTGPHMNATTRYASDPRLVPGPTLKARGLSAAILAASILVTSPLRADDEKSRAVPRVNLGGGYAFLRDIRRPGEDVNVPRGFWIFGGLQLGPSLAIAGEYHESSKSYDRSRIELGAWAFGPSIRLGSQSRWTPFFHVLAGVAWSRRTFSFVSLSDTDYLVQPGGGIELRLHDRASLRVQADLRTLFRDEIAYQVRVGTGVSVHMGGNAPAAGPDEDPGAEVAFGYALAHDEPFDWLRNGWWLAAGVAVHPRFSIGGEFSRLATGYDSHVSALVIGPHVPISIGNDRVTAFGRFMLGRAERQYSCGDCYYQVSAFTVQPGGGADLLLTRNLRARFAVDFRVIFEEPGATHMTRFTAGLAIRFKNTPEP